MSGVHGTDLAEEAAVTRRERERLAVMDERVPRIGRNGHRRDVLPGLQEAPVFLIVLCRVRFICQRAKMQELLALRRSSPKTTVHLLPPSVSERARASAGASEPAERVFPGISNKWYQELG